MTHTAGTVATNRDLLRDRTITIRRRSHQFYVGITVFLIATVVTGFWRTYFGTLLTGGVTRPLVMHLHGAVFTGWMALLLLQVGLAAAGNVRAHRRLGTFGIGYGALVLVMGSIVTIAAPVMHVRAGRWTVDAAAAFLLLPIVDMILFAGFFGAAIVNRHKPEIHKRLILAATVALAFAAVARMNFSMPVFFALWLAPMAAAVAFDVATLGRIHRVNAVTTAVMAMAFGRILLMETPAWVAIGRVILQPFL
ncbi:MAG TPA: hypothetical protein VJ691_00655 [Vicinamibacterales bacterium]|nr:hypothetical protein [Vicinamibacterales bacterium]